MRRRVVWAILAVSPAVVLGDGGAAQWSEWTPVFQGVDFCELTCRRPRSLRGYALRIDLAAPGVELLATPSNGDAPLDTAGLKTTTFVARHQLQAAINAAPFGPQPKAEGDPVDIVGLQISQGKRVSAPHRSYPALLIHRDRQASIALPPIPTDDVETAVGGFGVVLQDGRVCSQGESVHPRTAVGISSDGRTLFWLVVDGRQLLYSLGATPGEMGQFLKDLGAWDGLNLDGGGTTTMVLEDSRGRPRLVNSPVHEGVPGSERITGSHLGLRARRIKPD